MSGPAPFAFEGPTRVNYVAELVTPLIVDELEYRWFVGYEQAGVQVMALGRSSVEDYIDLFYGYYGAGHFPGPFAPPLIAD